MSSFCDSLALVYGYVWCRQGRRKQL